YPPGLIAVERGLELNGLRKRFDVVVFNNTGKPVLLVECKAPEEPLNEKVFEQIARYNQTLDADYLWVSNGTHNFCCALKGGIRLLDAVPGYEEVKTIG
ncbi:MAG TPA: type I restriction enzyme HsdR N-terminal domain-containing protein, partial [Chitinophagales bacterium]|nr:type I restriction enzyme HsdR N-terminal domain-containing protein [Chitinophagales bacterium]